MRKMLDPRPFHERRRTCAVCLSARLVTAEYLFDILLNMPEAPSKNPVETKGQKVYLYHMVPEDMEGTTLHPLSALATIHPDIFEKAIAKYRGREDAMETFIKTLDAKWSEVVHFSAIDPKNLKQALVDAGLSPREMRFYQVDPELLDPNKTTIYLFKDLESDECAEFDPNNLEPHSVIPDLTKEYFRQSVGRGDRPLLFLGIPHILHKGSIDVSNLPVITV